MYRTLLLALFLLACGQRTLCHMRHEVHTREDCKTKPLNKDCMICNAKGKRLRFVVKNSLGAPTMYSHTVASCRFERSILKVMEVVALGRTRGFGFNFTLSLTDPNFGYAVTGIKNVFNDGEAYWAALDGNNNPLTVGVDRYEPKHDEIVTFLYTRR